MQAEETRSRPARATYMALGLCCVALGYVGIVVPGMPSTVFFICALWAFKRSSPRFEHWLLNHRVFGPTLRNWEENRAISPRVKAIAIGSMAVCVGLSMWLIEGWTQGLVALLALIGAIYISTRKNS